jgi:hypothetical protein
LSCLPNGPGNTNNITKWYSINVTGIATITAETNNTITSIPPPTPSSPLPNPNAQVESESNQSQSLDVREEPDTNERIGEEIENLKDRMLEEVEENLRKDGIELDLH